MSIFTKIRKQKAVYWDRHNVRSDAYGRPRYQNAVEITCRWEDVNEEFLDDRDEKQVCKSKVYVDRDIGVGDYLALGEFDEMEHPDEPLKNEKSGLVKKFDKLPDFKARNFLRVAYL